MLIYGIFYMKKFLKRVFVVCFLLSSTTILFANTNDTIFLELAENSGLSETNIVFDFTKDGIVDCRRQEIFRGSNLVMTTYWQKRTGVSHAFHLGRGIVLIEDDSDGDGIFESISVIDGSRLSESFRRSSDGKVRPESTESLTAMQESVVMFDQLMGAIIDAAKNDAPEKIEGLITDEVEKLKKRNLTPKKGPE